MKIDVSKDVVKEIDRMAPVFHAKREKDELVCIADSTLRAKLGDMFGVMIVHNKTFGQLLFELDWPREQDLEVVRMVEDTVLKTAGA